MSKSLIIYSSTDGHTQKICNCILSIVKEKYNTKLIPIDMVNNENLIL